MLYNMCAYDRKLSTLLTSQSQPIPRAASSPCYYVPPLQWGILSTVLELSRDNVYLYTSVLWQRHALYTYLLISNCAVILVETNRGQESA